MTCVIKSFLLVMCLSMHLVVCATSINRCLCKYQETASIMTSTGSKTTSAQTSTNKFSTITTGSSIHTKNSVSRKTDLSISVRAQTTLPTMDLFTKDESSSEISSMVPPNEIQQNISLTTTSSTTPPVQVHTNITNTTNQSIVTSNQLQPNITLTTKSIMEPSNNLQPNNSFKEILSTVPSNHLQSNTSLTSNSSTDNSIGFQQSTKSTTISSTDTTNEHIPTISSTTNSSTDTSNQMQPNTTSTTNSSLDTSNQMQPNTTSTSNSSIDSSNEFQQITNSTANSSKDTLNELQLNASSITNSSTDTVNEIQPNTTLTSNSSKDTSNEVQPNTALSTNSSKNTSFELPLNTTSTTNSYTDTSNELRQNATSTSNSSKDTSNELPINTTAVTNPSTDTLNDLHLNTTSTSNTSKDISNELQPNTTLASNSSTDTSNVLQTSTTLTTNSSTDISNELQKTTSPSNSSTDTTNELKPTILSTTNSSTDISNEQQQNTTLTKTSSTDTANELQTNRTLTTNSPKVISNELHDNTTSISNSSTNTSNELQPNNTLTPITSTGTTIGQKPNTISTRYSSTDTTNELQSNASSTENSSTETSNDLQQNGSVTSLKTPLNFRRRRAISHNETMYGHLGPNGTCICPTASPTPESMTQNIVSTKVTRRVILIACSEDGGECDQIGNAVCNIQFKKCECAKGYIMNESDASKCIKEPDTVPLKYTTALPALTKKVNLDFEIEVGNKSTNFDKDLKDANSTKYKKYKKSFEDKLSSVFSATPGFIGIEVYGFRRGSIIAEYGLILKSFSYVHVASSLINKTIRTNITKLNILDMTVNKEFVIKDLEKKMEKYKTGCKAFSQDICPVGSICETIGSDHHCVNPCFKHKKPVCGEHGTCHIELESYNVSCSCTGSDGFVYHGEHCEEKAEKLKLHSKYIIAIAAGCGGALLLVTVFFVMCFIRLKRKTSRSPMDDKDSKPISMIDLRGDRFGNSRESLYRPYKKTIENVYHTGLPGQEIKYLQGREHKIYKDDNGDETYVYQPTSNRSSAVSEYSTGPTVYDYIDTESKFSIQRPNIRLGHLNKF